MAELNRIHVLKLLMVLFSLKDLKKLNSSRDYIFSSFFSLPAVEGLDFYSAEIDFIV